MLRALRYSVPVIPRPSVIGVVSPIDRALRKDNEQVSIVRDTHEKAVRQFKDQLVVPLNEVSFYRSGNLLRLVNMGIIIPQAFENEYVSLGCITVGVADYVYGEWFYKPFQRSERLLKSRELFK